jgi:hypothetical protein
MWSRPYSGVADERRNAASRPRVPGEELKDLRRLAAVSVLRVYMIAILSRFRRDL